MHGSSDQRDPEKRDSFHLGTAEDVNERPFTIWTAMGLGHSITNTAIGITVGLGNALPFGGPPVLFWGFLAMAVAGSCIGISLAELSSAYPHSGGQYYWVGKLGPPSSRRFLSYIVALISWASALCVTASIDLIVTQTVLGMATMAHPSFVPKPWITFVGYQLVNLLAFGFNFFERCLPWCSKALLIYTPSILFAIFVALLAGDSHKQPAVAFFIDIKNISGWPTGLAFLIGLNTSAWSFSCLDAVTHLADEIPQPKKNIPKALICTIAVGFVTGLPVVFALMFSTKDLEAIGAAAVPSLEIFHQLYNSKAAAIALQSLVTASAFGAAIGSHTWQSRMAWAFSRNKGLPFSRHLSQVTGAPFHTPIWSHIWSNIWVVLLGCLYLASDLAFNSLVAGGLLFQYISYISCILCLLYHGRSNIVPGPFWLPKLGYVANVLTLVWCFTALIIFSFPYFTPVAADEMNYVIVVIGAVFAFGILFWFIGGRNSYQLSDDISY
ncbi:amino acid/polyamine transporter I [Fusarium acuminatum]|uniref:Amino acid/polyamine transporter I n=1 Tax=Fusarium acuminatum TaxID=5515 RepID=A0ABZ2XEH0_9HYPO